MAQRIVTTLIDDLDPDVTATGTIVFGLDGTTYEIDLSDEHSDQMRTALQPFLAAARTPGATKRATRAARTTRATPPDRPDAAGAPGAAQPDAAAVRAWAKEHDVAVSERGRIKGTVIAQFLEATR